LRPMVKKRKSGVRESEPPRPISRKIFYFSPIRDATMNDSRTFNRARPRWFGEMTCAAEETLGTAVVWSLYASRVGSHVQHRNTVTTNKLCERPPVGLRRDIEPVGAATAPFHCSDPCSRRSRASSRRARTPPSPGMLHQRRPNR